MWEFYYKESWALKNWCFWTVVLEKTLRVPWTARRSNQSTLKEISPKYSLKGLMLKLKLQYFSHLMRRTDSFEKTLMLGKNWRREEKGTPEDEMVGWHHRLNGHGFGWTLGVGDRQGGLACMAWHHGVAKSRTQLSDWKTTTIRCTGCQVCGHPPMFCKLVPFHPITPPPEGVQATGSDSKSLWF